MFHRNIGILLLEYASEFRSIAVVGPRQSGKSTLVKTVFIEKPYVTLEDIDIRKFAESDTRGFLNQFPNGAIIDEVQRVSEVFNYLQNIIDTRNEDGLFVLTGSNQFLLHDNISQTLAGRIGFIDLYPLTMSEITPEFKNHLDIKDIIFRGFYPEVIYKHRNARVWFENYIRTYVERDVKLLKNIDNVMLFMKFVKLCAGRTGQILNYQSLSVEAGIDHKTVQSWLGILQSSFIIKLIQPYYSSFNKRTIKAPKLYFIDTGLACNLLGLRYSKELDNYHSWGALFENFVIMEFYKNIANLGLNYPLYYWRDSNGIEIDLMIDKGTDFIPIEIKASQTFQKDFTKNIKKIQDLSNSRNKGYVVYQGDFELSDGDKIEVINYNHLTKILA
jgi:predicted AAA+ superfamily ATPase